MIERICVFCGSSSGQRPEYQLAAESLGAQLAERGIGLVYGGGRVGLMGIVADAVLRAGGEVIGVIPRALWEREVGHERLTELHVVDSMHARKAMMAERADAFLTLPGGLGTMEELFEVWTWAMLGLHAKPIGLLNVAAYFDSLIAFLDYATTEGFIAPGPRASVLVDPSVESLLDRLTEFQPPRRPQWIASDQT